VCSEYINGYVKPAACFCCFVHYTNCITAVLVCIAQLVIIAVSAKYIAGVLPGCLLAYYFIQKFYLKTSRQLRIMDIEAKSPLFSNFLETIQGLTTIRAFGWEQEYGERNCKFLAESQKPFYLLYSVQRWLSLVLDMTVAGFAVVLVGIAVGTLGSISAGFLGLALVNVTQLSDSIKALITQWTILETALGAVTRVKTFTEGMDSEHLPGETDLPPDNWPVQGIIEYKGLSAYYK
jgi:ATP-binding cassette subfamily C (CFTR/MRP) protein 1